MTDKPLLSVENLNTTFKTDGGLLTAVGGVDFEIHEGETVCIVGESGSGKTVASESVTRLVPSPPGEVTGSVKFRDLESVRELASQYPRAVFDTTEGTVADNGPPGDERQFVVVEGRRNGEITDGYVDLTRAPEKALRTVRGGDIAHIFQNPQDALNHCYTVGWQIVEAVQMHEDVSKAEARQRAINLLSEVGIPNAAARLDDYPHEFSGGQKQRVMIAMALVTNPDVLIADEPTTALDVTVQAQILKLLGRLQEELGMGILFITHDLGVVAEVADHVVVMYAGKVMERGTVYEIFEQPSHPYTRALLECLPGGGRAAAGIGGSLPDPTDPPDGCRFAPRCEYAIDDGEDGCFEGGQPEEAQLTDDHCVSCVYYRPGYDASVITGDDAGPATSGGTADD